MPNTVPKRPYVCLLSSNAQKHEEFCKQFDLYNLAVVRYATLQELLYDEAKHGAKCLGWMREEGRLKVVGGEELDFEEWLTAPRYHDVWFSSTLRWYPATSAEKPLSDPSVVNPTVFNEALQGHLFPFKPDDCAASQPDFGWDPYFHPVGWNAPRLANHKCSPRNHCIARLIASLSSCSFSSPVVWVHHPVKPLAPVSFDVSYYAVADEMFPNTPTVRHFFETAIRVASNAGTLLRFSENKRQRVAWVPGGNAGQPANPKPKDPMHEKIYFGHDTLHHTVFDLILTSDDPFETAVYTLHRLMSELITLPGADMIEVAACQSDGIAYETVDDRKIFDVYRRMFGSNDATPLLEDPDAVRRLLESSVRYGVLGDPNAFGVDASEFRAKYDAYVVQDLRWTEKNAQYIAANHRSYASWHRDHALYLSGVLGLETVSEFIRDRLLPELHASTTVPTAEDLVLAIFRAVWKRFPLNREAFPSPPEKEPEDAVLVGRRFLRWAVYQMLYFYREGACLPNAEFWKRNFSDLLRRSDDPVARDAFLKSWKSMLEESRLISLITPDDERTYAHLYPYFPASYIGYNYSEQDQASVVRSCTDRAARLFPSYQNRKQ